MKWFKRICLFIVTMFLLALPTLIFKTDLEFYNSLVGPKIPPIVFVIVWSIIDICVSIFFVYTFENRKKYNKKDLFRTFIFLALTYLSYFMFPYFFLLNIVYF